MGGLSGVDEAMEGGLGVTRRWVGVVGDSGGHLWLGYKGAVNTLGRLSDGPKRSFLDGRKFEKGL